MFRLEICQNKYISSNSNENLSIQWVMLPCNEPDWVENFPFLTL